LSVKATMEGVVRAPSLFSITLAFLPSITATQELVVPRSMPMTFAILYPFLRQAPAAPKALRHPPRIGLGRENPGLMPLIYVCAPPALQPARDRKAPSPRLFAARPAAGRVQGGQKAFSYSRRQR